MVSAKNTPKVSSTIVGAYFLRTHAHPVPPLLETFWLLFLVSARDELAPFVFFLCQPRRLNLHKVPSAKFFVIFVADLCATFCF